MDFTGIELFIKEKLNDKNFESVFILKLLLENDSLTENSIFNTTLSFLQKYAYRINNSYTKFVGTEHTLFLQNKISQALSDLTDNNIIRSSGNTRRTFTLISTLETTQKTRLLKITTFKLMEILKIKKSSELLDLDLNSLVPYFEGTNEVKFSDVKLHEEWIEGQPPTHRMLISSMIENFEKKTRQLVKTVYINNDNWIKEKVSKDIRTHVNSKILEKQERAQRTGQKITLDYFDQFLNSTDYGTLITIIFSNQKDFSKALNDIELIEIKPWLLNIKRIRDPRSHADETFEVNDMVFNQTKFFISSALERIESFLDSHDHSSSSSSSSSG